MPSSEADSARFRAARDPRFKKVLVVDDITYVVRSIGRILEAEGYFVLTAKTGQEALDKFADYSPDLITVDQKLPDMTGLQLVGRIRRRSEGAKAKIVFISGVTDKSEIQSILLEEIDGYLVKPFKKARLIETVRALVKLHDPPAPSDDESLPDLEDISGEDTSEDW
ncbi:MAG: hypothetical protein CMN78_02090 [Spirochaetales bacterium]|nr:hypothetical protein [Spirochaetales bacterium]